MAKLSVSVDVPLSPQQAWDAASDLSRFSEWLSIHKMWRSALPETLGKGSEIDSVVEVKGMLNSVHWTIVNYKPPESMTLNGNGVGGANALPPKCAQWLLPPRCRQPFCVSRRRVLGRVQPVRPLTRVASSSRYGPTR
ncbi:MAG: SRPBCC family protein [Mycobacterium sp.]